MSPTALSSGLLYTAGVGMLAVIVLPVMSLLAPAWFAAIPPWVLWSVPVVTVTAFASFFAVRPEVPPMR